MTAPRRIRTTNADPLNNWKLPIGHDMPRATTEHNRATAAAWLEARRRRTGRVGEIDLDALRAGKLASGWKRRDVGGPHSGAKEGSSE